MKPSYLSIQGLVILVGLLFSTLAIGCRAQPSEQRYQLHGIVISVDVTAGNAIISHEAIPGFMGSMTMSFVIKDREGLDQLEAGNRVGATLVVQQDQFWIEKILSIDDQYSQNGNDVPKSPFQLPELGTPVPDFTLVNQDGNLIRLHQYRGRPLLLTFIYTRCPLPDYCPLMNNHFAVIRSSLQSDSPFIATTQMLTVSFDPEFDTPEILRSYRTLWTGGSNPSGFNDWEFATGTSEQIKKITTFFGLEYWQEKNEIIHRLQTALIDPNGRIFRLYSGNDWTPEEVLRDLKSQKP